LSHALRASSLAWLSQTCDQAEEQPGVLAAETVREQNPRPAGEPDLAPGRLARFADLGVFAAKASPFLH